MKSIKQINEIKLDELEDRLEFGLCGGGGGGDGGGSGNGDNDGSPPNCQPGPGGPPLCQGDGG